MLKPDIKDLKEIIGHIFELDENHRSGIRLRKYPIVKNEFRKIIKDILIEEKEEDERNGVV